MGIFILFLLFIIVVLCYFIHKDEPKPEDDTMKRVEKLLIEYYADIAKQSKANVAQKVEKMGTTLNDSNKTKVSLEDMVGK